ncbi:hypothetical protein ACWDSD_43030 [Streptomyces spiralis]
MPGPEPEEARPARTKRRRIVRTIVRLLRPVVVVLQAVYYAVRVVRELMD